MWRAVGVGLGALVLAGCGSGEDRSGVNSPAAAEGGEPAAESGVAPAAAGFDLTAVPLSTAELGAFPYFSLPEGYERTGEESYDHFAFPFWVEGAFRTVEGKVHMSMIGPEDGRRFSRLELQRNIEAVLDSVGSVKVSQAPVPIDAINGLGDQVISNTTAGTGDIYNNEVATYVIRRPDKTIWVHFDAGSSTAGLTVAETAPLRVTAGLLPADQLRRELEADGRVAIQVNFAVDKAEILPDSRPQIDAVLALLRGQPDLRLAVEGHTDNTGAAAHNRALSEARARSVVAALTSAGVGADRLQPRGFGPDRPVADNQTEAGRASNRRVELVRL